MFMVVIESYYVQSQDALKLPFLQCWVSPKEWQQKSGEISVQLGLSTYTARAFVQVFIWMNNRFLYAILADIFDPTKLDMEP